MEINLSCDNLFLSRFMKPDEISSLIPSCTGLTVKPDKVDKVLRAKKVDVIKDSKAHKIKFQI